MSTLDKCIYCLFEEQRAQTPNAAAVICRDSQLSYAELGQRANRLGHSLEERRIGPETLVGLWVNRSLEMIVGILGILKAGGAYVPLDPQYPQARLDWIRRDADLKLILTTTELLDEWPHTDGGLELLDIRGIIGANEQASPFVPPPFTSDQLAYVLYTSGSTGAPKGVMIEHRNVLALLRAFEQVAPSGEKLVGTSVCPFGFDVSVWEIFSTLCFGGTLHILRPDTFADPQRFARYLIDHAVTSAYIPPALLPGVVGELENYQGPVALDRILVGVEPIRQSVLQRFRDRLGQIRIVNGYGPTETTVCATFFNFQAADDLDRRTPIGVAVQGYTVHIVNQELEPVPTGEMGEILVGGAGVGRGYLNRPELTADKFTPDPFSNKPGARLYRTGDMAHYLPDGNIEFLGRADHQVKIRGFRVELSEIETILSQHPAIARCVVLAREDVPGNPSLTGGAGKRLVAYVVPKEAQSLAVEELRGFLKDKLPGHMLPSAFVLLQALPLTPHGKIDRQALPAPDTVSPRLEGVKPCTLVEEVLVEIWRQVLGLEYVDVQDNFFDLGGHSLLATQVVSRARQAFQVELSLRDVFESPTVAGLAKSIESARRAGLCQAPPILPMPRDQALPLSFAQQRLWLLSQLEPASPAYNIPIVYHLIGSLDLAVLEQSLSEIVQRHEALRTSFVIVDEQPIQVIAPAMSMALTIVDLRELPEAEKEAESQYLADEEARQPFNLAQAPLVRSVLLQLGDEEHKLILTMHHIVSDDWSMGVFNRELATLYESFLSGQPSPLSNLPIQYADFACWQQQWLQGEILETLLAYWKEQLGDAPPLGLPTDRPRPAAQTFRDARQSMLISRPILESLKALSRQEGATLFMTLLAAFKTLLYRYTGQKDIVVGSPIANRNQAEIEGLIGFFVNTLVLRTNLGGNLTFRELLSRVREMALGAYAHQDLPFEKLVQVLQPERRPSYNPLFQVAFALQTAPLGTLALPGLTTDLQLLDNGTAKFDLTLELWEKPEGLCGQWEYSTDLFDAATIVRMAGHYQTLLESTAATPEGGSPDRRLAELPMLTSAEREQALNTWNYVHRNYPTWATIHHLFEDQVARTPEATALVFENESLTFDQLNRRANQLAHHLQKLGVEPGKFVGLCLDRSVEMIIAILGVLKAGGTYVPLDPAYPQERMAFMLQDTQAFVLLTRQQFLDRLPEHTAHLICLDTDWHIIARESQDNLPGMVSPGDLAYIIYTSGSTGKPKGVPITHANICPLLHWGYESLRLTPNDRVVQFLNYCFDWSVWEIFITLTSGASLHIVPLDIVLDPQRTLNFLDHNSITVLHATPTQFQYLAALGQKLDTLRHACIGAEKLTLDLVERSLGVLHPDCRIFNMYGPTEAAIMATTLEIERSNINQYKDLASVPIGPPIANTRCYILDQHGNPQPAGVPGELCLAGDGLSIGYLGQPELTASKFIPDPFAAGARMYKTGDLARWLPDGVIEFLGRIDHQVKLRGFRIELGEIEAVLGRHPAVRENVAVLREDSPGHKRLVAYVIPNPQPVFTVNEVHQFLKEKLPDYMVPSAFVLLDAFPLMPNGKLDHRAFPTPETARAETGRTLAPRTPVEKRLAEIWARLLGLEQVGIHDSFFDLGGHSLLATRLLSRICDTFQVELSLRNLFETPTVANLATAITQAQAEQEDSDEINRMLKELESLSEEEARTILRDEHS